VPELEFTQWLGLRMLQDPIDPNSFRSEDDNGIQITEVGTPEAHRGKKKRKVFWSVTLRVDSFYAIGNDFDRSAARDEAWAKLKELVGPLIEKFGRLGFIPPN
jgi:hypothetical protein